MSNTHTDPYLYKDVDVLKNKLELRDAEALNQFECDISFVRAMQLKAQPTKGKFDFKHLCTIHKKLFADAYAFAGKVRSIDISKGTTRFAHAPMIQGYLSGQLNKLAQENYLKGTSPEDFSARAAYYIGEINAAHPFREGNGRTTREFINQLAALNGYAIAWQNVTATEMIEAAIASMSGDNSLLEQIIRNNLYHSVARPSSTPKCTTNSKAKLRK